MKRVSTTVPAFLLALTISVVLIPCALLCRNHPSVGFRCGLLATASDPYLDGSRRLLQKRTWHLGNGTRTWGETYGMKYNRLYLSLELSHTNPRLTANEAREND